MQVVLEMNVTADLLNNPVEQKQKLNNPWVNYNSIKYT